MVLGGCAHVSRGDVDKMAGPVLRTLGDQRRWAVIVLALMIALSARPALAGDRVALVVGNQHYVAVGSLSTPINDATDIAAQLTEAGFKVVAATDLDERSFAQKLSDFAGMAESADLAVFYYAGHGLQYK